MLVINGIEYEMDIEVKRIELGKNIYSDYRGWMSPDGELNPLYGIEGHTKLAKRILHYNGDNPIGALQDAGWIRVVCKNSYSCKTLDENTRRLLLGMVLRQRDCSKFFMDIGGIPLQLSRESAIEYLGQ